MINVSYFIVLAPFLSFCIYILSIFKQGRKILMLIKKMRFILTQYKISKECSKAVLRT